MDRPCPISAGWQKSMNIRSPAVPAYSAAFLVLSAGMAASQTLTVTTTASGSLTHSLGSAVAKVVTEATDVRLIVQPQGASALNPLSNRTAEFGFANSYDVVFFV